ncbi:MAG: hypothetical protein ACI8RD_006326, partial [Bacillariaceae sp.]
MYLPIPFRTEPSSTKCNIVELMSSISDGKSWVFIPQFTVRSIAIY